MRVLFLGGDDLRNFKHWEAVTVKITGQSLQRTAVTIHCHSMLLACSGILHLQGTTRGKKPDTQHSAARCL